MADAAETTVVNPTATGFDLGATGNSLLTLALDVVRQHTAGATSAEAAAPAATPATPADSPSFFAANKTALLIAGAAVVAGWLLMRK